MRWATSVVRARTYSGIAVGALEATRQRHPPARFRSAAASGHTS